MVDYYDVDESIIFDLAYVQLPIKLGEERWGYFIACVFFVLMSFFALSMMTLGTEQFNMTWTCIAGLFTLGFWYSALHYKNRLLTPDYLSIYPDYIEIQKENNLNAELERIPFKYLYRTYFDLYRFTDDYGKTHDTYYLHLDYIRFDYEESDHRRIFNIDIELVNMSERDARYYAKVVYLLMRNYHQRHDLVSVMEQIYTTPQDIPR